MKQMKEMILTIAVIVFSAGIIYVVAQKFMNKHDVKIQKKGDIHTGMKRPF